MEKAKLDRTRRILKITKRERNHELLLSVINLQELGFSPFPYIVLAIPCPFPEELIKGGQFTIADLLKSIPGSSSQAGYLKFTQEALATFIRPDQSPLVVQDLKPTSQR